MVWRVHSHFRTFKTYTNRINHFTTTVKSDVALQIILLIFKEYCVGVQFFRASMFRFMQNLQLCLSRLSGKQWKFVCEVFSVMIWVYFWCPGWRHSALLEANPVEWLKKSMISNVINSVFEVAQSFCRISSYQAFDQVATSFWEFWRVMFYITPNYTVS